MTLQSQKIDFTLKLNSLLSLIITEGNEINRLLCN